MALVVSVDVLTMCCEPQWSLIEMRGVIRFLWPKIVSAVDIHCQLVQVYGGKVMSRQYVERVWGEMVSLVSIRQE